MKAIINEKLYNTTTASVVFSDGTSALFKTKNDAYFRTSSEGIVPLTDEEAKAFLPEVHHSIHKVYLHLD